MYIWLECLWYLINDLLFINSGGCCLRICKLGCTIIRFYWSPLIYSARFEVNYIKGTGTILRCLSHKKVFPPLPSKLVCVLIPFKALVSWANYMRVTLSFLSNLFRLRYHLHTTRELFTEELGVWSLPNYLREMPSFAYKINREMETYPFPLHVWFLDKTHRLFIG